MWHQVFVKLLGTEHSRNFKKLLPIIAEINRWAEKYRSLSDSELTGLTAEFRQRLQEGAALEDLLPEAYGAVKETCRRLVGKRWMVCGIEVTWDMVPFDVQLAGGVVLHRGKIAEMATGEGKTLVATMPLYLNALSGSGAHLVTVNDYLARRDREWMGPIYETLGLTVDCIQNEMDPPRRRTAYAADITYGTNNEFGFDYLRDNMAIQIEDCVQRGHYYAIVDEVDSVLIDEARTPLIISGPVSHSSHQFDKWKPQIERLFSLQTRLINKLIADAEGLLDDEERREEAARMLLQARRGAPKNKKLMKLLKDGQVAKLIHKVEGDLMVEKMLHTLDDDLYYSIDERGHVIDLTEKGQEALYSKDPEFFILPDIETETQASSQREDLTVEEKERAALEIERRYLDKKEILHNIQQLLRAYSLFEKDDQYVLHEGKVLIVDEFTGRLMPGRRYSDGLHQALEAKEGVQIERETQTLATITLQNYFRLYKKLAGMTGTAETEASEFYEIYKLDVQVIPTHLPVCRTDHDDVIFRTKREKFNAVIEEIQEMYAQRRPVLVGTTSVESSETVSRLLRRTGIKHNVLNAKYHQQEAEIVSHAGEQGAVMIATNMAGRGTDIKPDKRILEVVDPKSGEKILGGLHIIGTERHEARRIDRQLRGRAGRQGDPGSSRFYLSLEDDLMRLFGMDRLSGVMARLGMEEGVPIEHPAVTRSIERAQKKVEAQNFQTRKHLLEYDDVMNKQRTAIYSHRREILEGKDQGEYLLDISRDLLDWLLGKHLSDKEEPEAWDLKEFGRQVFHFFGVRPGMLSGKLEELGKAELQGQVCQKIEQRFRSRHQQLGDELASFQERMVMLQVIDRHWREHLYALDGLKEGIGLRGYGQRDPLVEYKRESFELFQAMNESIQEEMLRTLFHLEILPGSRPPEEVRAARPPLLAATHPVGLPGALPPPPTQELTYQGGGEAPARPQTVVHKSPKVGRNDPCPCGSGLKYKKCHGKQVG